MLAYCIALSLETTLFWDEKWWENKLTSIFISTFLSSFKYSIHPIDLNGLEVSISIIYHSDPFRMNPSFCQWWPVRKFSNKGPACFTSSTIMGYWEKSGGSWSISSCPGNFSWTMQGTARGVLLFLWYKLSGFLPSIRYLQFLSMCFHGPWKQNRHKMIVTFMSSSKFPQCIYTYDTKSNPCMHIFRRKMPSKCYPNFTSMHQCIQFDGEKSPSRSNRSHWRIIDAISFDSKVCFGRIC